MPFTEQGILNSYMSYLASVKDFKPVTLSRVKLHLNKLDHALGKSLLLVEKGSELETAITKAAALRKTTWNGGMQDNGQQQRFRIAGTAVGFYAWAVRERLIAQNPYHFNTFRIPAKYEAGWLDDNQLQQLFNADMKISYQTLVRLMVDTGIRREELCQVKMTDLDMDNRTIHIRCGKNGKARQVPFTETTQFWLQIYLSMKEANHKSLFPANDYLFSGTHGQKLHAGMIGKTFHEISKIVGFRCTAHMLRHTTGRLWIEAGVSQIEVMNLLGHDDLKVTRGYIHSSAKRLSTLQAKVVLEKKDLFKINLKTQKSVV